MPRTSCLIAVLSMVATAASGQQATRNACADADHRQFDFWVGDWEVTDSAGKVVYGSNSVTREEDGCLIHEHWVGSRGGTGQSLNFLDPATGKWEQVWVGSDGLVLQVLGGIEGTSMVLVGDGLGQGGKQLKQRASWTPQADGRVRQYWQQSADGGATWTVAFDGWYRRKKG